MRVTATRLFHLPPQNLNCAQAILAAYRARTGDAGHSIEAFQAFGGGRAPGGVCGAIHAACELRPESAEAMQTAFLAGTGAMGCQELKAKGVSCKACVELAAGILEDALERERIQG